jgi:hypothetical protein
MPEIAELEKLGWFYLGRPVDPATMAPRPEPLLYDSRDLVTHALIVGMTGSGKTGLGVGLLEEAALDGVPALVLDPKGDLANLLLAFPELTAEQFLPWVREEEAARRGIERAALAAETAGRWREGLASWGQDGERIRRLRAANEVALYTPGSDAGRPISILASFAAPPKAVRADGDLLRDRVETTATSLLGLAGIEADPLRSREHILVATLLDRSWRAGRGYDLAGLIADLQKPPLERVGVLDLETFYPARERFELAMRINHLLASPGFEVWMRGEPLDLDRLLYGPAGRPRTAVVSLAHLSDAERMFLVALLLDQAVAWMRGKPGTASLRAILYMDEVFGYLPPVANPPSKKPMLTLLKQARAFGLGVVLATQNPVDLDYKAISNIGTWFLGRLQTERDKARVLDGLEGASTASGQAFDRAEIDRLLSGLRSRVFLLHDVHEEAPVLFETRWTMSYLAGPLDREQVRRLAGATGREPGGEGSTPGKDSREGVEARTVASATPSPSAAGTTAATGASPPLLDPAIPQVFLPFSGSLSSSATARFEPRLLGVGRAFVEDPKRGVSERIELGLLARFDDAGLVDWMSAEALPPGGPQTSERPADGGAAFGPVPQRAQRPASYAKWNRDLAAALARKAEIRLWLSRGLGELSRPGESERDFRIRLAGVARERRDTEVEKLRARYAGKVAALEERIRKAEARVAVETQQADQQKLSTILAGAASVAGMLFGRKRVSATSVGRVGTAVRSLGRQSKEAADIGRAQESAAALREQLAALERELEAAAGGVGRTDPAAELLEEVALKPKRADVEVLRLALAWVPAGKS